MNSKLRESLSEKKFVFTAETSPPDSGNAQTVTNQVNCLKDIEKSKKEKISNNSVKIDNEYSHQNITNQYINLIEKISR